MAGLANILGSLDGGRADVPDTWMQGRTLYGGLTAAISYHACTLEVADLPPLASMQFTFVGPVSAEASYSAEVLRRGKNVVSLQSKASEEKGVMGTGLFMFGAHRESSLHLGMPAPYSVGPDDAELFFPPEMSNFGPSFAQHFDVRLVAGSRPLAAAEEGYICCWVRHKDPASREGAASFVAIGDMLPPAAMPMLKTMAPISSMNWQVNCFPEHAETEDGWWLMETRLNAIGHGYSSQVMRYWNSHGELYAEGLQCIAVFG